MFSPRGATHSESNGHEQCCCFECFEALSRFGAISFFPTNHRFLNLCRLKKMIISNDILTHILLLRYSGTMTFGEQNSYEDAREQLNFARESGINFFDVAEM